MTSAFKYVRDKFFIGKMSELINSHEVGVVFIDVVEFNFLKVL